jgi:hypothetical protein
VYETRRDGGLRARPAFEMAALDQKAIGPDPVPRHFQTLNFGARPHRSPVRPASATPQSRVRERKSCGFGSR